MFGWLKKKDVTWESKEIDRKYLFAEIGRLIALVKQTRPDEKVRLPNHLKIPAIRSKQINDYDIKILEEPEHKEILEAKDPDHYFGNFN